MSGNQLKRHKYDSRGRFKTDSPQRNSRMSRQVHGFDCKRCGCPRQPCGAGDCRHPPIAGGIDGPRADTLFSFRHQLHDEGVGIAGQLPLDGVLSDRKIW